MEFNVSGFDKSEQKSEEKESSKDKIEEPESEITIENLAEFGERIREVSSTNKKEEIIYRGTKEAGEVEGLYLARSIGRWLFPNNPDKTLGVGESTLLDGCSIAGLDKEKIKESINEDEEINNIPDAVAKHFKSSPTLTSKNIKLSELFKKLRKISNTSSRNKKSKIISGIISNCGTKEQVRWSVQLIDGGIKLGASDKTILKGVTRNCGVKYDKATIDRALKVEGAYETAKMSLEDGALDISLEPLSPISPMLAERLDSCPDDKIEEAEDNWVADIKYDGMRINVHKSGGEVRIYTRDRKDVTESWPEIVEELEEANVSEIILDGEIIGYETEEREKPIPFNEFMERGNRKHNVGEQDWVPEFKVFDIIYFGGGIGDTTQKSWEERRKLLQDIIYSEDLEYITPSELSWDSDYLYKKALDEGYEGIIYKDPNAKYKFSRSRSWIKRKPLKDSIDCAITGAEFGTGKRAGLLGSFEISVMSEGVMVDIGKVGTGFTDEELEYLTEYFMEERTHLIKDRDGDGVELKPELILEIEFEEFNSTSDGYGLRFLKMKSIREDIDIHDVDTLEYVRSL